MTCNLPPEGWWCSRPAGHVGPCAARERTGAGGSLDHGHPPESGAQGTADRRRTPRGVVYVGVDIATAQDDLVVTSVLHLDGIRRLVADSRPAALEAEAIAGRHAKALWTELREMIERGLVKLPG